MRLGVEAAVVADQVVAGDIEIEDGRVTALGLTDRRGSGLAVPGFIDVHVHGHGGVDFVDATHEDHVRIARDITVTGVTAYHPTVMTVPLETMLSAVGRHPTQVDGGARVLGFHLEGPFLSPEKKGAHKLEDLLPPSVETAAELLAAGPVAHMTLAPEGAGELIDFLVRRNVVVSVGHSIASAEETREAVELGASAATHVFNAMSALDHRDPGILGAVLASDDLYLTAIFDRIHLADEASRIVIRCGGDRLVAITDGTSAVDAPGDRVMLGDRDVQLVDGVPRLPDGTIAGSVLTMDRAFRNLLDLGVDVPTAVRATATAPARLAGLTGLGSITPGSMADIVVLNDRFEVRQTLVDGVEVYRA